MKEIRRSRRVLAGMLAVMMVAGAAPASLYEGGFLAGTAITASADETGVPQYGENEYLIYTHTTYGFDVKGKNGGNSIQTTYNNAGYLTTMKVGENNPQYFENFEYGKQYVSDGVSANITAQLDGRTVNIIYTLTNTTNETKTVKIGSSGDVKIGSDDYAPCSFTNNGIKMVDHSNTNQFVLIPGNGNFTTKWLGVFHDAANNVFNSREDITVYDGDSGIAWSWTIEIPAGATVTKIARLFAGDANVSQVAYDANGGTGSTETILEIPGEHITLDTNNFVRDGYLFKGWDTDSAGETVVYAYGADFTIPETDTVLYAVWEKIITKEPEAISPLVYNGGGQDLITAGEVKEGKLVYAMGDDEETAPEADAYSENIPGAVDAGNYYVWYEVVNDDNLVIAKPACIETVIEKADPVFTAPTANELTEDGTVQDLITTSDCDGGDMLFAMTTDAETTPDEDAFGDEIPTADESGTYYVWYKVKGDKNHNDSEPACVTVTVAEGNWLIGDVNNDGKINVTDIAMAAAHVKGKRMLTKDKFKRADVNFDGVLDVSDITLIAAHVKGKKMLLQKNEIPQTEETPQTEDVSQTEEEA